MKGIYNIKQYLVLLTTLFIVLLQPLHSLQHVYEELFSDSSVEHATNKQDDAGHSHKKNCSVCEFTIQPFLVAEVYFIPSFEQIVLHKPVITAQPTYFFQTFFHSYLRGPPSQFLA